ncbi:MAG: ATP-binding protein [Pseudomonadota bacterium]
MEIQGYHIEKNPSFVGRRDEIRRLDEIVERKRASFIVVYGRRRVGKTELIEQYFCNDTVLKFEGIEIDKEDVRNYDERQKFQIDQSLKRLAKYLDNPLIGKVQCRTWGDFFDILSEVATKQNVVIYFEEIQWLANYESHFFSELKPFWDDRWRHNEKLKLVICGSSTSFIVGQLLSNKAIYSRSQEEFHLREFNLMEIRDYLGNKGHKETMLAQLTVGGIPEYLGRLKEKGTVLSNLCKNSFRPDAFFSLEKDKIFISSLSRNHNYQKIVEYLGRCKFATALEITKAIKGDSAGGGSVTRLLEDLSRCGFIKRYTPIHKDDQSKLIRYSISDEYLQFYFRFIKPKLTKIQNKSYVENTLQGINKRSFETVMGFNFERWCQKNASLFAKILGFSGVEYESGSFFDAKTQMQEKGFQIDLMYIIKGSKIIICEIKFYDGLVDNRVCEEVKRKIELFQLSMQRYKNYTYEAVLITTEGVRDSATIQATFDHIITFEDIFDERYW